MFCRARETWFSTERNKLVENCGADSREGDAGSKPKGKLEREWLQGRGEMC